MYEDIVNKAGYAGRDVLRESAADIFQGEFDNVGDVGRMPSDAIGLIPPRPFKKGGKVNSNKTIDKEVGGYGIKEYFPKKVPVATLKKGTTMKSDCRRAVGGMIGDLATDELLHPRRTIYERDMAGMRPSKSAHLSGKKYKDFEDDTTFVHNKGGRAGHSKYAKGGVGKVRHGQSTMHGMQVTRLPNKSK